MGKVTIDSKVISWEGSSSMLELLLANEVEIDHSCGGNASCGTCRVLITEGLENVGPRNEMEQDLAEMYGYEDNERLSCQLACSTDLTVELP